jgi:putative transposase
MTVRNIQAYLEKIYGIEVSPELVSCVTDAMMDEVCEWQTRHLDTSYPIVLSGCPAGKWPNRGENRQ